MSDYFGPLETDLSRGLLLFSRGKKIQDDGAHWLAILGANLAGRDPRTGEKLGNLSLDERAEWTVRHSDELARIAKNPWDEAWWHLAKKPLQFYAFWRGVTTSSLRHGYTRDWWTGICASSRL